MVELEHTIAASLIRGIAKLAYLDAAEGVPDQHPTNTGAYLELRLRPTVFDIRLVERNGDSPEFRRVHTACRWFMRMHDDLPRKEPTS